VRRDGALYLLNLQSKNFYDKHILQWGAGKPEQRTFLIDNIRKRQCDTFLDIGSNLGLYAVDIALQTDCKTIIAYDADQRNYDRIRTHLFINDLTDRVETRVAAVSDQNGTVPRSRGRPDDGYNSIVHNDRSGLSVRAVRLERGTDRLVGPNSRRLVIITARTPRESAITPKDPGSGIGVSSTESIEFGKEISQDALESVG
jgi:FkbM family methyltransferase